MHLHRMYSEGGELFIVGRYSRTAVNLESLQTVGFSLPLTGLAHSLLPSLYIR